MHSAIAVAATLCLAVAVGLVVSHYNNNTNHTSSAAGGNANLPSLPLTQPSGAGMHPISLDYPNLRLLHSDPHVFVVPHFFTKEECAILLRLGRENGELHRDATFEGEGAYRTSSSRVVYSREVPPSLPGKIEALLQGPRTRLEHMKVLRYRPGEYYKPHNDGEAGPLSHGGFENSARLATLFVYLNDVPGGGETRFTKIGVDVKPEAGMAVVHFPTSADFANDERTTHQSLPVKEGNEKFILVTWLWKDKRTVQWCWPGSTDPDCADAA